MTAPRTTPEVGDLVALTLPDGSVQHLLVSHVEEGETPDDLVVSVWSLDAGA